MQKYERGLLKTRRKCFGSLVCIYSIGSEIAKILISLVRIRYMKNSIVKKERDRRMRMKRVLATGLVGIMSVAALGGCGSKDSKDASKSDSVKMPSDPYEIVELASERTTALDSYEMNGSFNFAMDAMGSAVEAKADFSAIYFKDPMQMKMDVDVAATSDGETEDVNVELYFMNEEDTYVIYAGLEEDGAYTWTKTSLDPEDESQKQVIEALDSLGSGSSEEASMEAYKDCFSLDKDNDTDDATAILFTLTAQEMLEAYNQSADVLKDAGMSTADLESSLSAYGLTTDSLFSGMGDITANMTVDKDQVYLKSMSMDLATPIQNVVDVVIDGMMELYGEYMEDTSSLDIKVSACDFTLNYDKYNEATKFEIPEEAKNAEEVSTDEVLGENEIAVEAE